jgi:hypothetical protein
MKRQLIIALLAGLLSAVMASFNATADEGSSSETTSTQTSDDC